VLYVFGSAASYLLAAHASEAIVEVGEVEEGLIDNAHLGLQGVLWELDQDIAAHASDEARLVAAILAFAEQLMDKIAARASNVGRLEPFTSARWRVESDDFAVNGFTPARKAKASTLTMTFKKPNEVVGNHIATGWVYLYLHGRREAGYR